MFLTCLHLYFYGGPISVSAEAGPPSANFPLLEVEGHRDDALSALVYLEAKLQALARRRQLDHVDRCCSALHDALLESEGLEALVDLEEAVWNYAREASTDHGAYDI